MAYGPTDAGAQLGIANEGPQLWLLWYSDAFSQSAAAEVQISVRAGRELATSMNAIRQGSAYGLIINRSLFERLTASSRLDLELEGKTSRFWVEGISIAMDQVSRCAGMPTLMEAWGPPNEPVAGAEGWTLDRHLPGAKGCSVRRAGDDFSTVLALDNAGKLILSAARPDWVFVAGQHEVELAIDDRKPEKVVVSAAHNLFYTVISDASKLSQLRTAAKIHWKLPNAVYTATIVGFGEALDGLLSCH